MNNQTQNQPHAAGEAAHKSTWMAGTGYQGHPDELSRCRLSDKNGGQVGVIYGETPEAAQAKAAITVRAFNNHAALVGALQNMLAAEPMIVTSHPSFFKYAAACESARALLANLEAAQ